VDVFRIFSGIHKVRPMLDTKGESALSMSCTSYQEFGFHLKLLWKKVYAIFGESEVGLF